MKFLCVLIVWIVSVSWAAGTHVAVLETVSETKDLLTISELHHITDKLRAQAVTALPAERDFTIMTRENIQAMLPPGKAMEECLGSCLVETGKNIAADYVAQGRVGKFGKRLTLTVELYETRGAKLVGSLSVENSDADGLLVSIDEKVPFLFGKLRGTSWVPTIVQTENSVLSPAQSVNI
ncbi:MAG: hypothetical protein WCX75_04320 [Fibrobacteraceae bacterium]